MADQKSLSEKGEEDNVAEEEEGPAKKKQRNIKKEECELSGT